MITLLVTVDREIQFISSPELPAGFRRAIASDNTYPNPLHGKRKTAPATVEAFHHNPFTKEVALPRSYWPQFVARAEEFGVQLQAVGVPEEGESPAVVIHRQVAVSLQDLAYGLDTLRIMLAASIPTDWDTVTIQVRVTRHQLMSREVQDGEAARPSVKLEKLPLPWEGHKS